MFGIESLNGTVSREFAFAANELTVAGEWLKISPYGDFPNKVGVQRIQPDDAAAMVAAFNSLSGRVGRLFLGLPVFVGHPDLAPDDYPDKRRYGKITALEARAGGLYGRVAWNDLGRAAVAEGHYLFNSPAWYLRRDGKFVRPVELISVGLTNTPQIPGDPWAKNETPTLSMTEWLTERLGAAGLIPAGAAVATLQTAVTDLLALPARVTELETQLTAANDRCTGLTTEREQLIAARNQRELDLALAAGRITAAERAAWNDKFAADFESALAGLAALPPAVNTASQVADLGRRKGEAAVSGEKIALINAAVRRYAAEQQLDLTSNEGYNRAFAAVRREQPALFA